jgi:hypothetical protein
LTGGDEKEPLLLAGHGQSASPGRQLSIADDDNDNSLTGILARASNNSPRQPDVVAEDELLMFSQLEMATESVEGFVLIEPTEKEERMEREAKSQTGKK